MKKVNPKEIACMVMAGNFGAKRNCVIKYIPLPVGKPNEPKYKYFEPESYHELAQELRWLADYFDEVFKGLGEKSFQVSEADAAKAGYLLNVWRASDLAPMEFHDQYEEGKSNDELEAMSIALFKRRSMES